MIRFENVTFKYNTADKAALTDFNIHINPGTVVCLTGLSGCGKSTVLRLINGLIPHFFPGNISGNIYIDKQNSNRYTFEDSARKIGSVFQNPRTQFFCTNVVNELAFELENNQVNPEVIQSRIDAVVERYQLKHLIYRDVFHLSGGEQQIIACACMEIAGHEIIIMDEPSSNLDFKAIEKLSAMIENWKQQGKTIVIAEHRLHYLIEIADKFVLMQEGQVFKEWDSQSFKQLGQEEIREYGLRAPHLSKIQIPYKKQVAKDVIYLYEWHYRYQKKTDLALNINTFAMNKGAITAIIGNNGAGKSTFAKCMIGALKLNSEAVFFHRSAKKSQKQWKHCFYQVFQNVQAQLFGETVEEELRFSNPVMNEEDLIKTLKSIDLEKHRNKHPLALSNGEMQRLAIASAIESRRPILIFDEPSSGLDGKRMLAFAEELKRIKNKGYTILVISHDYELIMNCADDIVEFDQGRIKHHYTLDQERVFLLRKFFNIDRN